MSRTYRRKGAEHEYSWLLTDYIKTQFVKPATYWSFTNDEYKTYMCSVYTKVPIDPKSKEGQKLKAKFHNDSLATMNQVPSWYKKEYCRKPFKRKEKQALVKQLKYLEEDIVFPVIKKDALYYW
jgi:hypothetical protein